MAVGILVTIIVFLLLINVGMGGLVWWLFTQQDDDDDNPRIVMPEVHRMVKESLEKHMGPKKKTDDYKEGTYNYSSVDNTPPDSSVPLLIGAVPAVQVPNTTFQSHSTVPENSLHSRLFTHFAG